MAGIETEPAVVLCDFPHPENNPPAHAPPQASAESANAATNPR
jgi:hypothetical protein